MSGMQRSDLCDDLIHHTGERFDGPGRMPLDWTSFAGPVLIAALALLSWLFQGHPS